MTDDNLKKHILKGEVTEHIDYTIISNDKHSLCIDYISISNSKYSFPFPIDSQYIRLKREIEIEKILNE